MIRSGAAGVFAAVLVALTIPACRSHKPHSPDLTRATAARIISQTPQFSQGGQLVKVNWRHRGPDDVADCCYAAEFEFRETGVNQAPIKANALFRYWGDDEGWHL
jgi:hypothetical protein